MDQLIEAASQARSRLSDRIFWVHCDTPEQTARTTQALGDLLGPPNTVWPLPGDAGRFQAQWHPRKPMVFLDAPWQFLPSVWIPLAGGYWVEAVSRRDPTRHYSDRFGTAS